MQGALLSNGFSKLWCAYERQLQRRPYLTQAATSAALWGMGDVLAQKLSRDSKMKLDKRRVLLTAAYGAAFVGPVGHAWYKWLDSAAARFFPPGSPAFIGAKVVVDTAVLGPFYVLTYFAFGSAFIDQAGWKDFETKMRVDFLPTLTAEIAFWPVFQAVNFSRVPLQHQLLAVNCMTMLDAAFMSWARSQDDWVAFVKNKWMGED